MNLAAMTETDVPVVVGAGAIGLSAVAALHRRAISPIIVSDFNPDRRALAKKFGTDIVVDPAQESPYDAWRRQARRRDANPRCVIFECVGAPGIVNKIVADSPHGVTRLLRGRALHRRHRGDRTRHPEGRTSAIRRRTRLRGLVRHPRRRMRPHPRSATEHRHDDQP